MVVFKDCNQPPHATVKELPTKLLQPAASNFVETFQTLAGLPANCALCSRTQRWSSWSTSSASHFNHQAQSFETALGGRRSVLHHEPLQTTWSGGDSWPYGFVHHYFNFDALSSMVKGEITTQAIQNEHAALHHLCIPFFGLRKINYFCGDIVRCFLGQRVASSTC
jgi:hypothetical protein